MKRLILALSLTLLFVSASVAELYIVPDGAVYLNGTVNFMSPQVPFVAGAQFGGHPQHGYAPYGPAAVSPYYWASYPMVPIPMVGPSGPIDAWAERLPRGR